MCGSPVYSIALANLSLPNNYISFNGGDILTINTDQTAEIESKLTVKVKNTYYETTLIETTFKWVTCESKTPVFYNYAGITPELMFDY